MLSKIIENKVKSKHITSSVMLERRGQFFLMKISVLAIVLGVIAFFVWAYLTPLDEIATAQGSIVPSSKVQEVKHIYGGMVEEILVKEGDSVTKGEPIVKFNKASAESQLNRLLVRRMDLVLEVERITSYVQRRKPNFLNALKENNIKRMPTTIKSIKEQRSIFNTSEANLKAKMLSVRNNVKTLQSRKINLQRRLRLNQARLATYRKLKIQGAVSNVEYNKEQSATNEVKGDYLEIVSELKTAQDRVKQTYNEEISQSNSALGDKNNELKEVNAQLTEARDRSKLMVLTATIDGKVANITITGSGAVVSPGGHVLDIVPVDSDLIAQVKILPRDSAFIKVGKPAIIKLTTYDFSRYGGIKGKVIYVSDTAIKDQKGVAYFHAKIHLDKYYVGKTQGVNMVTTGMDLNASIITGKKSLLHYLLKPIYSSMDKSFSER